MATSLDATYCKLRSRLRVLDSAFERHLFVPSKTRRIDRFALQEGLISGLWQSWCAFCRSTVIGSARGTISGSGQNITSPYAGRSEMEIAYVAKLLAQGKSVSKIRALNGSHLEPTWGALTARKSVVTGKSGAVRVTIGGGLPITTKKHKIP